MSSDKPFVIYDHRVRWVAAVNMAFVVAGIWFGLRFCSGSSLYVWVGFLALYSLFWIRDLLFGFRSKLLSDGSTLYWQEGKETGSVPLAQIRKILIGVKRPARVGFGAVSWTFVRFLLSNGEEQALPPSLASGLRARKWGHLKRLVSHIRKISNVPVEPIPDPDLTADGWKDEQARCSEPRDDVLVDNQ